MHTSAVEQYTFEKRQNHESACETKMLFMNYQALKKQTSLKASEPTDDKYENRGQGYSDNENHGKTLKVENQVKRTEGPILGFDVVSFFRIPPFSMIHTCTRRRIIPPCTVNVIEIPHRFVWKEICDYAGQFFYAFSDWTASRGVYLPLARMWKNSKYTRLRNSPRLGKLFLPVLHQSEAPPDLRNDKRRHFSF